MRHQLLCAAVAVCLAAGADITFLPKANLINSKVVETHLLADSIAQGGILGEYRDRTGAYQLMLARLTTNDKAAFLLLDVKKLMSEPHYLSHMGGFAGMKSGKPFYVFAKGPFVAAISGKSEPEADVLARIFAARLPLK